MPRVSPLSAWAESALNEIVLRLSTQLDDNVLGDRDSTAIIGRHVTRTLEWRARNTVVDIVAIVESYSINRLVAVNDSVSRQELFTWKKREGAYLKYAGVNLEHDIPDYQKLKGFVEARNAIQHGLGSLTDLQLGADRRRDTFDALAVAGIPLQGDTVVIQRSSVERCRTVSERFVLAVDHAVLAPQTASRDSAQNMTR